MVLLPFDAHNHVHMQSSSQSIFALKDTLSGMAVMSTHPRDFPMVADLAASAETNDMEIIPCMGVHPWFLHELTEQDWEMVEPTNKKNVVNDDSTTTPLPRWVSELELLLQQDPTITVGEIGLDNFHFNNPVTKELSTDMETQMLAMEFQLGLAIQYQRPVSVHCVRAMGSMLKVWNKVLSKKANKNNNKDKLALLPPRIYFHAFGGKAATVIQLVRLLEPKPKGTNKKKKNLRNEEGNEERNSLNTGTTTQETPSSSISTNTNGPKVYFGFAPIVNFQSPKTLDVIREVGLERLVLETDHEQAHKVPTTMKIGLQVISEAFGITKEELIEITNKNAKDLYMLD